MDDLISDDDTKPENVRISIKLMISGRAIEEARKLTEPGFNKTVKEVLEFLIESWAFIQEHKRLHPEQYDPVDHPELY